MNEQSSIRGGDVVVGTRVKTWFMPKGTAVIAIDTYRGPLQHLWPQGARIITFNAATPAGALSMTVGNNEFLQRAASGCDLVLCAACAEVPCEKKATS